MLVYSQHGTTCVVSDYFIPKQKYHACKEVPLHFPHSLPPSLSANNLCFVSLVLSILNISHWWNHTLWGFLWLTFPYDAFSVLVAQVRAHSPFCAVCGQIAFHYDRGFFHCCWLIFLNCKIHSRFAVLTMFINALFSGIKYIHIVM